MKQSAPETAPLVCDNQIYFVGSGVPNESMRGTDWLNRMQSITPRCSCASMWVCVYIYIYIHTRTVNKYPRSGPSLAIGWYKSCIYSASHCRLLKCNVQHQNFNSCCWVLGGNLGNRLCSVLCVQITKLYCYFHKGENF